MIDAPEQVFVLQCLSLLSVCLGPTAPVLSLSLMSHL